LNDSRVPVWTNLPRVPSLSLLLSPPLRAVYSEAKVILLDEPLAAMGAKESAMIIDLILELKQRGDVSMILIAHNFAQVVEVCDRVNLLQHGRIAYEKPVGETSVQELTDLVSAEYRGRGLRTEPGCDGARGQ
ncbi:MAG: hypothetical protein ACRDX9_07135, partial [Acidimicrobiia bacterium]